MNSIYSKMSFDWLREVYTNMLGNEHISSSERRKVIELMEKTERRAWDIVNISTQAKALNSHF